MHLVWFFVVLSLLNNTRLVNGCNRGGNRGHELAAQTARDTQVAINNLKTYVQQEFFVVNARINELQAAIVEVIAPQAARIANATESIAKTADRLSWRIAESLNKVDDILKEVLGGIRLVFIILLLIGSVICQYIQDAIGNVLKPSIRIRFSKTLFYILQIFCCVFAFGILIDFFLFSVLQLPLQIIRPEFRVLLIYTCPLIFVVVYYIVGLTLTICIQTLEFIKFILHGPYLLSVAPYVVMYQVYKHRKYYRNRTGVYIAMFSISALPIFVLGLWQLFTGRHVNKFSDFQDIEVDTNLLGSILLTHLMYLIEAIILQKKYPIPDMAMVNRPYKKIRFICRDDITL